MQSFRSWRPASRSAIGRVAPLALLASLGGGCAPDAPETDATIQIGTHVVDWRDEVVYQLLVDRFGDGDLSNDLAVNPSGLGRYQGGDWQGVLDHMDYLKALGVTAIWISPVVRNVDTDANFDGYHGYWAQDLLHTNPHFGDLATLRRMVDALHANGFKVIQDIVTNHMGQLFFYDINGNGVPDDDVYGAGCPPQSLDQGCTNPQITHLTEYDPDYDPRGIQEWTTLGFSGPAEIRWVEIPDIHRMPPIPVELQNKDFWHKRGRIVDYTNMNHQPTEEVLTGDFPGGLKDLKTDDPDVQKILTDAYTYWIGAADIDAFRIDTLKHVDHGFWQYFTKGVRAYAAAHGKKNFFMFGEAFDGDDALDGSYTFNNEVDSVVYFAQRFQVVRDVLQNNGPTKEIEQLWDTRDTDYDTTPHPGGPVDSTGSGVAAPQLLVNFLDNHDITRFNFDKPCDEPDVTKPQASWQCKALWSALALMMLEQGVPCVYYGTEQNFNGGNDPTNRERLWDTGYGTSGRTFQYIRALSDARRRYSPIRHGVTQVRWSTTRTSNERDAGMFAFERVNPDDGKRALVVVNTSDTNTATTQAPDDLGGGRMATGFAAGTTLVNVLADPTTGPPPPSDTVTVAGDGTVAITLAPRAAKLFVPTADAAGISPVAGTSP